MATKTKAARKTAAKAGQAASGARSNPYVQRMIDDPELRDNVRQAFDSARQAYKRMSSNGKPPARALMEDKKLHKELRQASESLREAAEGLRGRKRRHRGRRLLLLMIVGAGAVLVFSADARKAVLDRLFGAEEEFEYSSTTSPA